MYVSVIKRILDITLSVLALVLLAPLALLLILGIKIDSEGPIFFIQKRVGKNRKHFNIYKFRTMRIETPSDTPTHRLETPDRWITRIGKFLRKTSLDEFPQLINIIKGDMSIVGPRPALWNQFDLIEERDRYGANDVMPGLTGWAQVNGRDTISIEDKAQFDGYYVEHASFIFDLRCIFLTIGAVLKRDGVLEGSSQSTSESQEGKRVDRETRTDNG